MESNFTQEEIKKIASRLGVLSNNLVMNETHISSDTDFEELYKSSRGCVGEDNWVLFLTKPDGSFNDGRLYKLTKEGIKEVSEKYKLELK